MQKNYWSFLKKSLAKLKKGLYIYSAGWSCIIFLTVGKINIHFENSLFARRGLIALSGSHRKKHLHWLDVW